MVPLNAACRDRAALLRCWDFPPSSYFVFLLWKISYHLPGRTLFYWVIINFRWPILSLNHLSNWWPHLILFQVNFIIQCLYSQIEQYAAECIHFNKLSLYMCLLDRFCSCNYLCVVRLFAESILRYGLSPSFLVIYSSESQLASFFYNIYHRAFGIPGIITDLSTVMQIL